MDRPGEQDVRISGSEVRPRHEDGAGSFANGHPWEAVEAVRATWERFRDRDNRRDPPLHVECLAAVEGPGEQDLVLVEIFPRSEEHTSELQSHSDLVCRLLLEKKK